MRTCLMTCVVVAFMVGSGSLCARAAEAHHVSLIVASELEAPVLHGVKVLEKALTGQGCVVTRSSDIALAAGDILILVGRTQDAGPAPQRLRVLNVPLPTEPESLVIQRTTVAQKPALILCGADAVGLMYAALDTAERVSWSQEAQAPLACVWDVAEKPYVSERAVSIYTMQRAQFETLLFDETYLIRYLDLLAASRINSLVVIFGYENGGFMAPAYPYFFDVEGFPDVRLVGTTEGQQARNTAAFRRMIALAHARGIQFCPAFWDHIYRGQVQGGGIAGASEKVGQRTPHLVYGVTTENLAAYNKAAMRKFLAVFPEIDALQFRMHGESGLRREEMSGFWHEIFSMIKAFKPDMRVDIRAKQLPESVIADGLAQGLNLRVATKYWMEQMGLPFHPTHVNKQNQRDRRHGYADLLRYPQRYPIHWRLWNAGTTRCLLWGDPEYVRRFAESTHLFNGDSFEINEMLGTKMLGEAHDTEPFALLNPPYQSYDYEFERYWHFYQVWGRVSYNPDTPSELWERAFQGRFGKREGLHLMRGLHLASQVLPRIVAASYRYRNFPTTRGWAEMMCQGDLPAYASAQGSDIQQFMNMADQARSLVAGTDTAKRRPVQTSQWFETVATLIQDEMSLAEQGKAGQYSAEWISTATDLRMLANLARFHARRLLAGVQYNLHKQTGDLWALDEAVALEAQATAAWAQIVKCAGDVYAKDLAFGVFRVGFSRHWKEELALLEKGLEALHTEQQQARLTLQGSQLRMAHVPVRRLAPAQPLTIRATVVAAKAIAGVEVLVTCDGKERIVAMQSRGQGRYEATVPVLSHDATLAYTLRAVDVEGQEVRYPEAGLQDAIKVAVSSDRQAPMVSLERIARTKPREDLCVHAQVTDLSGVKRVRLRYRHVTQFEDYESLDMTLNPSTGLYSCTIPGAFISPEWDLMYFAEAIDTQGNGVMIPDLEDEMPYVIVALER